MATARANEVFEIQQCQALISSFPQLGVLQYPQFFSQQQSSGNLVTVLCEFSENFKTYPGKS